MFTNILFFIIVFSIFSLYESGAPPPYTPGEAAAAVLAGYCLFFAGARLLFAWFEKRYSRGRYGTRSFITLHTRQSNQCIAASVGMFALYVYGLDIKYYLEKALLPGAGGFAQNLAALTLLFLFLVTVWHASFPSYRRFYNHAATAGGYVLSQLRLNLSLVGPWLICTAVFDLIDLLPESLTGMLARHEAAQYGVLAVVFGSIGLWYPRVLVRLWNCRPLPQGPLRKRLEDFCRAARFTCADIMLWDLFDGRLITAGVMGFVRGSRYLLISPTLLDILNEDELESVTAHEIGHVRHRHMLFYLVFVLGYTLFAYLFFDVLSFWLLSREFFFNLFISPEGQANTVFSLLTTGAVILLLLVYFRLLFGLFSRNFERQSDGYAIKLKGTGAGIASSLEKIAAAGSQSKTAHNWHHYGIQERIDYITRCETSPGLVQRHDRKVRRMVAAYCIALLVLGAALYGGADLLPDGRQLSLIRKIAEKKIAAEPDNPVLHVLLANIYFEQKQYAAAEKHYLAALVLQPHQPEVLNNLAWMYATAEDSGFRKPEEALRYSRAAAELDPRPHILDTLAESYFVNGDYEEAIAAIQQAITQQPSDLAYYKKQLQKFEEHLRADTGKQHFPEGERISL